MSCHWNPLSLWATADGTIQLLIRGGSCESYLINTYFSAITGWHPAGSTLENIIPKDSISSCSVTEVASIIWLVLYFAVDSRSTDL